MQNAEKGAYAYEYFTNENGEWAVNPEYKSVSAICSQNWDYVTMQQASGYSGQVKSYGNLQKLKEFAREHSKNSKFVWNMTWAYQSDSQHPHFEYYGKSQEAMYNAIVNAVQTVILPDKDFEFIIPVGTAIQNARTAFGDILTRDGFHLSIPLGRYIAALTWAKMLTKKSLKSLEYAPCGINEKTKQIAIAAVEGAVKKPFAVTKV